MQSVQTTFCTSAINCYMRHLDIIGHVDDMSESWDIKLSLLTLARTQPEEEQYSRWKHYLFNPWEDTTRWFEITRTEEKDWLCTYTVAVYDGVEATLQQVADTAQEALQRVEHILIKLQNGVWDQ